MEISWFTVTYYVYWAFLIYVTFQIIHQYTVSSRATAWLFTVYLFPVIGIALYFIFGVKRRKRKMYEQKLSDDMKALEDYQTAVSEQSTEVMAQTQPKLKQFEGLSKLIFEEGCSRLTASNEVQVLENGEEKFPALKKDLKAAKKTIHIQYYTFKFDHVGYEIVKILMAQATKGVVVRFIYDDYGSLGIEQQVIQKMRSAGIEVNAFSEIRLFAFADRVNYRNHRKIVVIDGKVAYVGGINIADAYTNDNSLGEIKRYWRDTHLRIEGHVVPYIENIFLNDWNFCAEQKVDIKEQLSDDFEQLDKSNHRLVQVVFSGPDSPHPSILFSMLHAIHAAQNEILITTPYFIPNPALVKALKIAVMRGVNVRLLVPEESDAKIVDMAAQSFYYELIIAGVEIFKYTKGFVHAKTMVVDGFLSVIGTANFDERSFELNFEVNVFVYDERIADQMRNTFGDDLKNAKAITEATWNEKSAIKMFIEKVARLISPIL